MDVDVLCVYNQIAPQFDKTRFNPWPGVSRFLESLPKGSFVADLGCGNGKYIKAFKGRHTFVGLDGSLGLLECNPRGHELVAALIGKSGLPWRDGLFDAVISVAVLHHIASDNHIERCLKDIHRVLVKGGRALLTLWAQETTDKRKDKWLRHSDCDYMVPWTDAQTNHVYWRYYKLYDQSMVSAFIQTCSQIGLEPIGETLEHGNWQLVFHKP